MKQFIKKVLITGIFISIFYLFFLCIWGLLFPSYINKNQKYKPGLTGFMNTRLKQIDSISGVDILFLGSSHTYRGFDTRIFTKNGFQTFNLGSSNQTPIQTNLLIKEYLEKLSPKLVIYEVYPENFEMDGLESGIDVISNASNIGLTFNIAIQINHITAYNTFIFSLFSKHILKDKYFQEPLQIDNDYYINGGYVQTQKISNSSNYKTPFQKRKWMLRENQWSAFIETITLLKNSNIPFLLVQAPVCKTYFESFKNNDEIDFKFKNIGPYINFNFDDELKLNELQDFYDLHHLTQTGVDKFNYRLLNLLNQNSKLIPNTNE